MEQTWPDAPASEQRITEQDLQHCGAYPIRLIGSIQPYGSLLAVSLRSGRVVHASTNLEAHTGMPAQQALGQAIGDILDCEAAPRDWLQRIPRGGRWVTPDGVTLRQGLAPAELVAHRASGPEPDDERIIIEIIPGDPATRTEHDLSLFVRMAEAMGDLRSTLAVQRFLQRSAELVQSFTGYDRVMIYRFAPDWSGEVIAESTAPGVSTRFLGLNFPASDIPPQARQLYETCPLRVLADVTSEPIALLSSNPDERLNQGHSLLRQMAPTHVQYLKNMGVRATLTLSLLKDDKLWGMVACHHHAPKMPPDHIRRAVRSACELIAGTVTLRLDSLLEVETAQRRAALSHALSELASEMVETADLTAPMKHWRHRLLALFGAHDLGLWVDGSWLIEPALKPSARGALIDYFESLTGETVAVPNLAEMLGADAMQGESLAGALAQRMPHGDGWVVLFREERIRAVRWAGRPDMGSALKVNGQMVLGPRHSFELWTETVRGHCRAWTDVEGDAIIDLARTLYNGLQQAQLQQAQLQLRQSEEASRERFELLHQITARVPGMVYKFRIDTAGHYSFPFASAGIRDLYGLEPEQVQHDATPLLARIHADDVQEVLRSILAARDNLATWQGRYRALSRQGHWRWHEASSAPHRMADGSTVWYGVVFDISDRMHLEQTLMAAQQAQRDTLEAIPDLLFEVDEKLTVISIRAPRDTNLVTQIDDQVGRSIRELLDPDAARVWEEAITEAKRTGSSTGREYQLVIDGQAQWFELSLARKALDMPGAQQFVAVARDITPRKRAEEQINQLAFYDALTGLCNRRLLLERLERAQVSSARSRQYSALIFMDLDNFKDLNDTQGHGVGDDLLRQVAERLSQGVRDGDTVARMGGDEFVMLLENLGIEEADAAIAADQIGRKLLKALNEPYPLGPVVHHCTASLGVTLFRDQNDPAEDVLRRADVAMYEAKGGGRNAVRFYDPEMQSAVQKRTALDRDMRLAIERGEFELFYQPIVDAAALVSGYEALLRWRHPTRGLVSPADFIPVAEQSGMILPIGAWVLEQACSTLAQWAADPERQHLTLSVNLSARQLQQTDFVSRTRQVLERHGLQGNRLKLELTESLLQQDVDQTIIKMRELAADGIRFALDDFGTGYSSLSYLKQLPLSQLKIDRSFVRDVLTDPNDAAIARTILQLALTLDLSVVAEGIETEGQLAALRAMGCQAFQGYLFGRPSPLHELG